MSIHFEYKNMSFEKVDGIWIHKDWALPGDFGDIHDKPASNELAEKVELAYQVSCLEKKLKMKEMPSPKEVKDFTPKSSDSKAPKARKTRKKDLENLDFTKPLEQNDIKNIPTKVKKTNLLGSFNPFKDGIKV